MICCLIMLAYTSSHCISSILYLKYADMSVKLPAVMPAESDSEEEIDIKTILGKNAFNLDLYNQERMQAIQTSVQTGAATGSSLISGGEFKGQLVGILKGYDKSYALIRADEKFYILTQGEVKDGLTVDSIGIKDVIIIYQGKKYQLKLVGDDSEKEGTAAAINNDAGSGTIKRIVKRKDVEENLSDINSLISTMFISPYYLGGEFVGYRIARMRMDAFLRQAGLENGDVLVRMNGERINTPEKMFELFTKWKDASAVTIDIIRRDQKRTVLVEIE